MRNFSYFECNELDVFTNIRDSKNFIDRKRLTKITPKVNVDYNAYLNEFNTIQNIPESSYTNVVSRSLRRCYSSNTKKLVALKEAISKAQTIEFQSTCPYCMLRTISTFDHYIPQEEYPVYAVLAKNLIPCCSKCNSIKRENWRQNNDRIFIHFLNDLIPISQFLFGTLIFNNSVPIIMFDLRPNPSISNPMYNLLRRHYTALGLFDTYALSVPEVISNIKVDVYSLKSTFGERLEAGDIKSFLALKAQELRNLYGVNYWKAITFDLLANSNVFLSSL